MSNLTVRITSEKDSDLPEERSKPRTHPNGLAARVLAHAVRGAAGPDTSQQVPTTGRAHNECLLPIDSAIERPLSAT